MTDRELMKQALEALEAAEVTGNCSYVATELLRTRLAQPEQEPAAWLWRCKPHCGWPEWSVSLKHPADAGCDGDKRTEGYEDIPLYTTPPQREWQRLTDKEREEATGWSVEHIEAKLKEKNT